MSTYGKLSKPTTSLTSIGLGLGSPWRRCFFVANIYYFCDILYVNTYKNAYNGIYMRKNI